MRHDLIEQLLAGEPVPGPSALDFAPISAPPAAEGRAREAAALTVPRSGPRALTAFDLADEDAEARALARRHLVGVAVVGAGSAVAVLGALAVGF